MILRAAPRVMFVLPCYNEEEVLLTTAESLKNKLISLTEKKQDCSEWQYLVRRRWVYRWYMEYS